MNEPQQRVEGGDALLDLVREAIRNFMVTVVASIEPDTNHSKLGLDSVATPEIVALFEDRLGLIHAGDGLGHVSWVRDLVVDFQRYLKASDDREKKGGA